MRKLFYTTVSLALFMPLMLSAQPKLEAGVHLGIATYQGDMIEESIPLLKEANLSGGLMGRYIFTPSLAVRANLLLGKITGDDYNYENDYRRRRGAKFSTSIFELSAVGEWEPLGKWRYLSPGTGFKKLISPYLFGGLGFTFIDPKTDFSRSDPDDIKVKAKIERDQNARHFTTLVTMPVGVGIKIDLSEFWVVGLEIGTRYSFSDYLDGVSISGNPGRKDWYHFSGISLFKRFN